MNNSLALTCAIDIPIPSCKLILHQPTIEEIAYVGNNDYFIGIQTLCLYKSMFVEDKNVLENTTNFQIFMMIMREKETQDKKICTMKVLSLLFPNYQINFSPRSMIFSNKDIKNIIIDETNFEDLQKTIRVIACSNYGIMEQTAFNPGTEKAKEIAQKLMRGRQRVAAQKESGTSDVFSQYISILSVGLCKDKNILKKYTMAQLYDEFERYMLKINWDIDLQVKIAGGTPSKEVDNWMKNF